MCVHTRALTPTHAQTLVLVAQVVELDLMTVDEAIDAMEAVGHDFFVYLDAETNAMQILYRRGAGGVGILKPVNRA
eukprot:364522-Chlamydomonas_euryale.AAC.11